MAFVPVKVTEERVGHKFAEFVPVRSGGGYFAEELSTRAADWFAYRFQELMMIFYITFMTRIRTDEQTDQPSSEVLREERTGVLRNESLACGASAVLGDRSVRFCNNSAMAIMISGDPRAACLLMHLYMYM